MFWVGLIWKVWMFRSRLFLGGGVEVVLICCSTLANTWSNEE